MLDRYDWIRLENEQIIAEMDIQRTQIDSLHRAIRSAHEQGDDSSTRTTNEHPIDEQLSRCLTDTSGQRTAGMLQCFHSAHQKWTEEMERSYEALMGLMEGDGRTSLEASQQAWNTYQSNQVELNKTLYLQQLKGTMYHVILAQANMDLVKERALQLQGMLAAIETY